MDSQPTLEKSIGLFSALMAGMEARAFQEAGFSELSMRQVYYLTAIMRMGEPTFSDLARALKVTKPSVTSIVGRLIRLGYLQKVQDGGDRRVFHLVLTPRGMEFHRLHENLHRRMAEVLAARLDEDELAQLTVLLEKMLAQP